MDATYSSLLFKLSMFAAGQVYVWMGILRLKCTAMCLKVFHGRMERENVLYGVERGGMYHCLDTILMFSFLVEISESLL